MGLSFQDIYCNEWKSIIFNFNVYFFNIVIVNQFILDISTKIIDNIIFHQDAAVSAKFAENSVLKLIEIEI